MTDENTATSECSGQRAADVFHERLHAHGEHVKVGEPTSEARQAGRNATMQDTLQEPGSADGRTPRAGRVTFGLSLEDSAQDKPQAQADARIYSQGPGSPQKGTNTDAPGTPINAVQLALELGAQEVARERAARLAAQDHQDILDRFWVSNRVSI